MLYSLSLSILYQRDKEAVLLWIAGIIPWEHYTTFLIIRQETISLAQSFSCGISQLIEVIDLDKRNAACTIVVPPS